MKLQSSRRGVHRCSMITRDEIDGMAKWLEVPPAYVTRDYVSGWMLSCLYGESPLAKLLVLKGGNCLRKGYFREGRYSNDLDFSTSRPIAKDVLRRELQRICAAVQARTGVVFNIEDTRVDDPHVVDGHKLSTKARVYFRDFYGKPVEQGVKVKVDVTQFDRLYLPVQDRELIHPYSDSAACVARIRCVALEEVLATKLRCVLQREHLPDLFDIAYPVGLAAVPKLNLGQLLSTFMSITIFRASPQVAKGLLLDVPFGASPRWDEYVSCPRESRLPFDSAKQTLRGLVDTLIRGEPIRSRSEVFFPSSVRNPILAAGRTSTLLRINYGGKPRMVEPYSLVFRILKDGVAREYLYVYDRTRGGSGPSVKTFLPGKAALAENTSERFEPRFEVELGKAGGAEMTRHFQPPAPRKPPPTLRRRAGFDRRRPRRE
jgi:predicted nucleotidyltransferase component of viral defense system